MNNSDQQNIILTELWQRVLDGDMNSLGNIHKILYSNLYNYAFSILNDEGLANDAVQEIFIKIWNKRKQAGDLKSVKAYLIVMLRRHILNQIRNMRLRQFKISINYEPDIEFSQEEIIIKSEKDAEKKKLVQNMLNQLPKRQKEVIYLKFYEEMEYEEIAGIMDINYQSVLNLVHAATKAIKKEMENL